VPLIKIDLLSGRTLDQRRRMVEGITDAVVDSLGVEPSAVRIYLHEIETTDVAIGGQLVSDAT
jgi:4-oxalocrotonate tautomerase